MKIIIRFKNWDKYQTESCTRKIKRPSWFRMENQLYLSKCWDTIDDWKPVLFFMGLKSSKANLSDTLEVDLDVCARVSGLKKDRLKRGLDEMLEADIIEMHEVSGNSMQSHETSLHNTLTGQDSTGHYTTPPKADLCDLWNQNKHPSQPECKKLTDDRRRKWSARWEEKPDKEYWEQLVKRIASTPFLCGEGGDGWLANVDWLLRPGSHVKVSEGAYDRINRKKKIPVVDFWKDDKAAQSV